MRELVISVLSWCFVLLLGGGTFFYLGWAFAVALAKSTPLPV